ncbi:hypothetical protein [Pontiella sp.]|uniref:hypothetical protein n=1 Tax=Pontiella sp. TaxID=2837462 RepID=UPI003569562A
MRTANSRSGQALIEFMLGLVGIMVLVLGINLIAGIVDNDFTTILSAREAVADSLINQSSGSAGGSSTYDFDSLEDQFIEALNPSSELKSWLEAYPGDRENQFEFLWEGDNPLQDLVGSEISSSTPVTSPLFQKVIGRTAVTINNAAYMPPWEDLWVSGSDTP